ncbi:MAG TPA: ROK family protein [Nitrospira sp.]|jgi:fructokinase|nr:ROK family protein [Nitrospira sp.]
MEIFGGIEAGGTKFICGIGTGPHDLQVVSFPTVAPDETIRQAIRFFRDAAGPRLSAVGIASFGPIDLDQKSATFGAITTTPKTAWRNVNLVRTMANALAVPVAIETDVNAAALAEAEWGAARGLEDCVYVTVGTGIGGGVVVRGRPVHGLLHPEIGHLRIPQLQEDGFPGSCPFHANCLEGLASGPALLKRWACAPESLPVTHPAWKFEAHYLAVAISTVLYTLSPQRIILGGGVMQQAVLFPMIRRNVMQIVNGYIDKPQVQESIDGYIVPPQLGTHSGVLGGILLAHRSSFVSTTK